MPLLEYEPQVVASVCAEDVMARKSKKFPPPVFLRLAVIQFLCTGSGPVQDSYFFILRDNVCTIFIKLRTDDSRSFRDISARSLQLPVINNTVRLPSKFRLERNTSATLISFVRFYTTFGFHCMFSFALQRCLSIRTTRTVRCLDGIEYVAVFSNFRGYRYQIMLREQFKLGDKFLLVPRGPSTCTALLLHLSR